MYKNTNTNNTSNTNCVSIIVIGAGLIGPRHAEHVVNRPNTSLFAIVDHSAKGPSVAQRFQVPLYKDLNELFEYCDKYNVKYPDAAIIATPNHTHVPLGLHLASKGIHLLVEKPLSPNAQDSKTLIEFCKEKNVKLLIGHHRRFNPYIITCKENLPKLGQVVAVQGTWTLCKPDSYFEEKPWRSSQTLGGGALLINLIHDLDNLQYLFGPVEKVYAELLMKQRAQRGSDVNAAVDEGAVLTLRFANGICGTFLCSDNVVSPFSFESGTGENPTIPFNDEVAGFYRIFGSHGTLSVPDFKLYHQHNQPVRSWLNPVEEHQVKMAFEVQKEIEVEEQDDVVMFGIATPDNSPNTKEDNLFSHHSHVSSEKPKPFDLQVDHFVNLILGKETEVKCSGEDALRALLCIEAVGKSIETGLPQVVPSIDDIEMNMELFT
ncbi:hypothetical protein CLIB1423_06S04192 [[Candida] railenensis]|uniref:Oxidoreductase n=1 Tax=[Candida] railenensis TaxID=45579 RepID=A0A9P0VXX6_9ASCO|nr:hypothetical protein CLIB1423_06S04192 [[Candida] railenensis]